jgi:hypothetical protein
MSTRTITITVHDDNDFDVQEGECICDRLTWDEMLGTVALLCHPDIARSKYRMRTPDMIVSDMLRRRARALSQMAESDSTHQGD